MLVICTDRSSTDVPFEVYDVSTTYIFVIASEKARIIAANCQNIANTSHIMKKKAINLAPIPLIDSITWPNTRKVRNMAIKP